MLTLKRNLDIRNWKDRAELTAALRAAGMGIDDAAIDFVSSRLTDEWFRIVTLGSCILKIGPKFSSGLQLSDWVQVIQSLYEFRDRPNLDERVRRLCLPTHERLDTTLVLCVAFRLSRHGFKITFEPNGQGSSDLLLERTPYRLYAEVKRENPHVHRRFERAHDLLGKISGGVSDGIADFLRQRPVRLEINLSRLFSDGHVTKVVGEITTKAIGVPLEQEIPLESVRGSAFIVMPREAEFHYQKGFHLSRMVVGRTPIQVNSPANNPVRCTLESRPNLRALSKRVREAAKQIQRDLDKDRLAAGLIVLESSAPSGDEHCRAIQTRFWPKLPERCWGVVLIPTHLIPRSGLAQDQIDIMRWAAIDPMS